MQHGSTGQRLIFTWLSLLLLITLGGSSAVAAPAESTNPFIDSLQSAIANDDEIAGLSIAPIDSSMSPVDVMRSRPFILLWQDNPTFNVTNVRDEPRSETQSWTEVEAFMQARGDSTNQIETARGLFDDPDMIARIPAPSLRAATLVFLNWDEYSAVTDSILYGKNDSKMPFASVEFSDFHVDGAVATLEREGNPAMPLYKLLVSDVYANAHPLHLALAILHESLHGGISNSAEEELSAVILDTVAYAEMLLIAPQLANDGTELAAFSNFQLYALLNSSSESSPANIGITDSIARDVFVGPGLDSYDALSMIDSVLEDEFYGSLPLGGSSGQQTTARIMERYGDSQDSVLIPRYDATLLNSIDIGISQILDREKCSTLASILGLYITTAVDPGITEPLDPWTTVSSPLAPLNTKIFDLNWLLRPPLPVTSDEGLQLLQQSLDELTAPPTLQADILRRYSNPDLVSRVPDSSARAALLLLSASDSWKSFATSLIDDPGLSITFAPMSAAAPVQQLSGIQDQTRVELNESLLGDSLPVLAAAIVEGSLLNSDSLTAFDVTAAAYVSTIAYAQLLLTDPLAASARTWGAITRNIDLLALMNSSSTFHEPSQAIVPGVSSKVSLPSVDDILPGLVLDASSFDDYIQSGPRKAMITTSQLTVASRLFLDISSVAGVATPITARGIVVSNETLREFEQRLGEFLSEQDVATLAATLELGVSAQRPAA